MLSVKIWRAKENLFLLYCVVVVNNQHQSLQDECLMMNTNLQNIGVCFIGCKQAIDLSLTHLIFV